MKWQIQAEGASYGIAIDNIMFVTTTPPAATVPPAWPAALIENCEDGDNQILLNGPRGGYWYTVCDAFGSTVCPPGAPTGVSAGAPFIMTSPGYPGSLYGGKYCAAISGSMAPACGAPWTTCPYTEMGFNFLNPQANYNISGFNYTGIQFYAESSPAGQGVAVGISDVVTNVSSDVNCWTNTYTGSWALYQVPFSTMVTGGWGTPTTHTLDQTTVIATTWKYTTGGSNYNFSVDDISFY
jgi:hypothetical protein